VLFGFDLCHLCIAFVVGELHALIVVRHTGLSVRYPSLHGFVHVTTGVVDHQRKMRMSSD
jgi:hypothetical protein